MLNYCFFGGCEANRPNTHAQEGRNDMRVLRPLLTVMAVTVLALMPCAHAAEPETASPPPSEGPPLPLNTIEGVGGGALVPMAYLVNPPTSGTFGKPAVSFWYANLDNKDLTTFTLSETIRVGDAIDLEFSYAHSILQLGDFTRNVQMAGLPDINVNHVGLHTFSVRTPLIREGAFDQAWMPAVTLGVSYKNNDEINRINRRLGGALTGLGMRRNDGLEFTLSATKAFAGIAGRPTIVTIGGRLTEANQTGFLGFTDSYKPQLEASVVCLVTGQLAVVAEYRMKPDELGQIPGLVRDEDDWWDVGFVYIFDEHLTATAAYVHFGDVLDEDVCGGFILGLKYEF